MRLCVCARLCSTLWPHGLWPTRRLCLWDSSGKSTGVGCHFLLQGIFPTQESSPSLPHCRQMLYPLSLEVLSIKTRRQMKKREDVENRTQDQVEGSPSLAVRNEPTQRGGDQQMMDTRMWSTHKMEYDSVLKRRRFWHTLQHGWTLRTRCSVKEARKQDK